MITGSKVPTMTYVQVTFKIEVSDPEDSTGLTEEDYDSVTGSIMDLGGYDIDMEVIDGE